MGIHLKKTFYKGVVAVTPLSVTLGLCFWLLSTLEHLFRWPVELFLGNLYFPGMGLCFALFLVFFVGYLVNNFVIRKFSEMVHNTFTKIPVIRFVYNTVADLLQFFRKKNTEQLGAMVMVRISGVELLGVLTNQDSILGEAKNHPDRVSVFIPMSYQVAGFTVLVPRSSVEIVPISVEEGLRFIFSGGVLQKNS